MRRGGRCREAVREGDRGASLESSGVDHACCPWKVRRHRGRGRVIPAREQA
jgi:hypothetical protein